MMRSMPFMVSPEGVKILRTVYFFKTIRKRRHKQDFQLIFIYCSLVNAFDKVENIFIMAAFVAFIDQTLDRCFTNTF